MEELATLWACEVGELPTTYLAHPLGALFKSLMVWDMIEERLLSSKGKVSFRLEKIQRDFFAGVEPLRTSFICQKDTKLIPVKGNQNFDTRTNISQQESKFQLQNQFQLQNNTISIPTQFQYWNSDITVSYARIFHFDSATDFEPVQSWSPQILFTCLILCSLNFHHQHMEENNLRLIHVSLYNLMVQLQKILEKLVVEWKNCLKNVEFSCIAHKHRLRDKSGFQLFDAATEIYYMSDSEFIDTGINYDVSMEHSSRFGTPDQQLMTVRSFPEGTKNCYTLQPQEGKDNKYLIRTSFMYGNYDSKNQLPEFKLYLGVNEWDTVKFNNSYDVVRKEIVHVPRTGHIDVCLVNTEARYWFNKKSDSQVRHAVSRYKDDAFDRVWEPFSQPYWKSVSTSYSSDTLSDNHFKPPSKVMATTVTPADERYPLEFHWNLDNSTRQFYVYMHFAEVEELQSNQLREFYVSLNGWFLSPEPIVPGRLVPHTGFSTHSISASSELSLSIFKTHRSTLPPILNALEIYEIKQLFQSSTVQINVDAIKKIKAVYNLKKNWQGDPCLPIEFSWNGMCCSDNSPISPSIISLDLSYNSLTGEVPNFLSKLPSLKTLNLSGNNLTAFKTEQASLYLHSIDSDFELAIVQAQRFTRVHHKNLVSLIGYCDKGSRMMLVYEHMAKGNLKEYLSVKNEVVLSWEQRLRIAIDAAQAKVADFGWSRSMPCEGGSYVSTAIVGTLGYVDPKSTCNHKDHRREPCDIADWVHQVTAKGDIKMIVDPSSIDWPTMSHVVLELKECLKIAIAHEKMDNAEEDQGPVGIEVVHERTDKGPLGVEAAHEVTDNAKDDQGLVRIEAAHERNDNKEEGHGPVGIGAAHERHDDGKEDHGPVGIEAADEITDNAEVDQGPLVLKPPKKEPTIRGHGPVGIETTQERTDNVEEDHGLVGIEAGHDRNDIGGEDHSPVGIEAAHERTDNVEQNLGPVGIESAHDGTDDAEGDHGPDVIEASQERTDNVEENHGPVVLKLPMKEMTMLKRTMVLMVLKLPMKELTMWKRTMVLLDKLIWEGQEKKEKMKNVVVSPVASITSVVVPSGIVVKPNEDDKTFEPKNQHLTYSEVERITENFQKELGRGASAIVYHGHLSNGTEVAVKKLSPSSILGSKQFKTEAQLLTRVHHKNLVSLFGYCDEGSNMVLIYEYMAKGNLKAYLSGKTEAALSWEQRLRIAIDAAQDFGWSKSMPVEGGSYVSTAIVGTPGYLDPDYHRNLVPNEKTDVYSFGIVLLELISNPRLQGKFETNSARRAIETAMSCVSFSSTDRPTMSDIIVELRECLKVAMTHERTKEGHASVGIGSCNGCSRKDFLTTGLNEKAEEKEKEKDEKNKKKKKKKNFIGPAVTSITSVLVPSGALASLGKSKKKWPHANVKCYRYSEVARITNNFQQVIGCGGFGSVYLGYLSDGTEAQLLTRIRHKNLVSLLGYHDEGSGIALIYEYMVKGSLKKYLSGQPALIKSTDGITDLLINWVRSLIDRGEIRGIVDPRLNGDFDINSARKAVETAMACVRRSSVERPTMSHITYELKECVNCLAIATRDVEEDVDSSIICKMCKF
ncbi:putative leucine-rich repeat receptor-like protein kinase [Vitis vinifera]|uniref:non-specific serine/threonine protein kinase n=1 Tax=Vitis vinifera TaxID=29760 RepID=A0A438K7E5_VITVI|nr:putative leucine-rich repeat receptor-like protein kinase [Vitis vinifera]